MKTPCPSCGGEVEFRFDDSFVRVCSYCRAAVLRTDRGVDSLGKVADLVPMDSPLRLFADGRFGSTTFLLVGMAQIRHGAGGLTQEWYAKFSGSWGWLAEAQGRYYLTFETEGARIPAAGSLSPGDRVELPAPQGAPRAYTVAEVGEASYVAASGELPFKLLPGGGYRFVDLADGAGGFATIDYGGDGDTPRLYVGHQVSLADLGISGGEQGPPRDATIASQRLACPSCNGPVELRAPGQTLRAACAYCNHLLDYAGGQLAVLAKLPKATPLIPLGTKGRFAEGEQTVIGYLRRSAQVDGEWYPFDEYLLHAPAIGFRWLVCSDGHWSYVQPVTPGAVKIEGDGVSYERVAFRQFQTAPLRVDTVLGEFYWKVEQGELVQGVDYVAPPAMLSSERSDGEQSWSLSTFMTPGAVEAAFGGSVTGLPASEGVAPNQPSPVRGAVSALKVALIALLAIGAAFAMTTRPHRELLTTVTIQPGLPQTPQPTAWDPDPVATNVYFSEPFRLLAGQNVELGFHASLDNNWAYVVAALVHTESGDVISLDASMERYSGYEDGEAWSEGSPDTREYVGPVKAGAYVLRLEMQHGGASDIQMTVRVRQNVFRFLYLLVACSVLGLLVVVVGAYDRRIEQRRWSNSSQGEEPGSRPKQVRMALATVAGVVLTLVIAAAYLKGGL